VTDRDARATLDALLASELTDPDAWILGPDGSYSPVRAATET
jgi:hypothetical protein